MAAAARAQAGEETSTRDRRRLTLYKDIEAEHTQPSLFDEPQSETFTYTRPVTRGDCLAGGMNEQRPCPFSSCRYHLLLDVDKDGNLTEMHADIEAMPYSCALDVADEHDRGVTLDDLVSIVNLSRERLHQLERKSAGKLRAAVMGGDEDE